MFFTVLQIFFLLTGLHQKAAKEYCFRGEIDDKIRRCTKLAFLNSPKFPLRGCYT